MLVAQFRRSGKSTPALRFLLPCLISAQDTLKVSGVQVSPVEIEDLLLAHPQKLIQDVTVAGVSGGRTSDEKVPRAWVVLSSEGQKLGVVKVVKALDEWHQKNLSKYKWLRGGIEVVEEVCSLDHFLLRDWLNGWRSGPVTQVANREGIKKRVAGKVRGKCSTEDKK